MVRVDARALCMTARSSASCAGSDLMHPLGALVTGDIAGDIFVVMFTFAQNRSKIDDVLGVGIGGTAGSHVRRGTQLASACSFVQ